MKEIKSVPMKLENNGLVIGLLMPIQILRLHALQHNPAAATIGTIAKTGESALKLMDTEHANAQEDIMVFNVKRKML